MLQIAFRVGAAAITSADIRSLGVVNTPCLPCSFRTSSSAVRIRSSWFDSTSKWCARYSTTSGNTARVISICGFVMRSSAEKNECHCNEQRYQHSARPRHVAEERRHPDTPLFRDRLHHQIRCIADVTVGAHEDGAAGNCCQRRTQRCHQGLCIAARGIEEYQISRRIIEEG